MLALLLAAADKIGQHEQSPPGPGSALPVILGVLTAVFLVGLALWFLIVRPRVRPPGRKLERPTDAAARFERGESAAVDAADRLGERTETRS